MNAVILSSVQTEKGLPFYNLKCSTFQSHFITYKLEGERVGDFQTYGLIDGKLIHISKVQSGLACGCICPNCKAALIARKGEKNKHTFAHRSKAESCGGGQETALHLLAKDIIANQRTVYIPPEGKDREGRVKCFDSVALEVRDYDGIIPDIIARDGAETLNIEIRVNHAIDSEKQSKLKAANLRTIEIDLHDLLDDFSKETVEEALLCEGRATWMYSPIIDKEERAQNARNVLCDNIPCEGQHLSFGEKVYCPMQKQPVWTMRGGDGCHHACNYFEYLRYGKLEEESPNDMVASIPCRYREKNIPLDEVEDVKNLERKNGIIVSVDILRCNVWEHWGGYRNSLLKRGFHYWNSGIMGKTVAELWNPDYRWMVIQNVETGEKMFIPGEDGHLIRHEYYPYGGILGRYSDSPKRKLHVIWNAEESVWSLIGKTDLEPAAINSSPTRTTPSQNSSIFKKTKKGSDYLQNKAILPDLTFNNREKQEITELQKRDEIQTAHLAVTQPKEQKEPAEHSGSNNQEQLMPIKYEYARCKVCNRVDNIRRFAKVEGEGKLKSGICIDCDKKSKE